MALAVGAPAGKVLLVQLGMLVRAADLAVCIWLKTVVVQHYWLCQSREWHTVFNAGTERGQACLCPSCAALYAQALGRGGASLFKQVQGEMQGSPMVP